MRISLADSWARGFNKWCEAHDGGRNEEGRAVASDVALLDETGDAVMTPPERPHQPWLVPGVGTL